MQREDAANEAAATTTETRRITRPAHNRHTSSEHAMISGLPHRARSLAVSSLFRTCLRDTKRWNLGLWMPFLCAFLFWFWFVWFFFLAMVTGSGKDRGQSAAGNSTAAEAAIVSERSVPAARMERRDRSERCRSASVRLADRRPSVQRAPSSPFVDCTIRSSAGVGLLHGRSRVLEQRQEGSGGSSGDGRRQRRRTSSSSSSPPPHTLHAAR